MSDGAGTLTIMGSDRIGVTWGLSTWVPGIADYWSRPTAEKLTDALVTLAHIHLQAEDFSYEDKGKPRRMDCSPSAQTRSQRLAEIAEGGLAALRHGLRHADESQEKNLGDEALRLIERNLAVQRRAAAQWSTVHLPLQWRLGDVWHDHVLFTGDRVTGIIDFGAAGIDSPAGDVARLLGSMVGDDRERWQLGLAAYESVRPMTDVERAAVQFFDTTGTVLSAANWVGWLWPQFPAANPCEGNRAAGVARLTRLVERLRVLAARGG
jgi:homoserine kinase type II